MSTSVNAASNTKHVTAGNPPQPAVVVKPAVSFRSVLLGGGPDTSSGEVPTLGEDDATSAFEPGMLFVGDGAATFGMFAAPKPAPPPVPTSSEASVTALPTTTELATGELDVATLARAMVAVHDDPLDARRNRLAVDSHGGSTPEIAAFQPMATEAAAPSPEIVRAQASLEDLLPELVCRVQWSGDGRKGTVRMELAGSMAGSTLLVSSDAGRVRVHLDVAPGVDASGWQQRITERLAARNIPTDGVEVT